jgi:hypothetical protein
MGAPRSWAATALMVLAAFAGGFTAQALLGGRTAAAQEGGQVIRARAFVLVDELGRERGSVALGPHLGASFTVLDDKGMRRLRIGELDDRAGWGLRVYDREGHNRMTAGLWEGAAMGMRVFDRNGTKRLGIGFSSDGENGGLALLDDKGHERLGMGMGPGGGGDFAAKDALGNDLWRALGEVGPPVLP